MALACALWSVFAAPPCPQVPLPLPRLPLPLHPAPRCEIPCARAGEVALKVAHVPFGKFRPKQEAKAKSRG